MLMMLKQLQETFILLQHVWHFIADVQMPWNKVNVSCSCFSVIRAFPQCRHQNIHAAANHVAPPGRIIVTSCVK